MTDLHAQATRALDWLKLSNPHSDIHQSAEAGMLQGLAEAVQQAIGSLQPIQRYWPSIDPRGLPVMEQIDNGNYVKWADVEARILALQQENKLDQEAVTELCRLARERKEKLEQAEADRAALQEKLDYATAYAAEAKHDRAELQDHLNAETRKLAAQQIALTRLQDENTKLRGLLRCDRTGNPCGTAPAMKVK